MDIPTNRPTATARSDSSAEGLTYEQAMNRDPEWAMSEGSRHFDENSRVFQALKNIAQRLATLEIPYVVVGGMALFRHGFRRFTEDVDILVTKENLKKIHEKLEGLGYRPPHPNSKHLRDTELRVKIEFLQAGEFPGDGLAKPLAFPDPSMVGFEAEGISYIKLENLIELKLASGMTGTGRLKDLADVLELIKTLKLGPDFSDRLHPYVREKFLELAKQATTRYVLLWRNKWLTAQAKSLSDMVEELRAAATLLDAMQKDGVVLEEGGTEDDYAHLVTTDPKIAEKYDMLDESEFWDDGELDT